MIGLMLALMLAQAPEQVDQARKLEQEARELQRAGKYADAEKRLQAAIDLWKKARGPDDVEVLVDSMNLAVARRRKGDFAGAVALLEKVLDGLGRCQDPEAPRLKRGTVNNLAAAYKYAGQPKKAQAAWEGLLASLPADGGQDVLEERARVLDNLASLMLDDAHDLVAAERYARQGYAMWKTLRGDGDDPDVAISQVNLAVIADVKGDRREARRLLLSSIRMLEAANGPDSPNIASALNQLAVVETGDGHPDAARAALERSLAISRKLKLDSGHYLVVKAQEQLKKLK
jgi:tetratricopeptide (TPR) repeat protein